MRQRNRNHTFWSVIVAMSCVMVSVFLEKVAADELQGSVIETEHLLAGCFAL